MTVATGRVPYRHLTGWFWLALLLLGGLALGYAGWIAWMWHQKEMGTPAELRGATLALDPDRVFGVAATFYNSPDFRRPLRTEVIGKPFSFRTEHEWRALPQGGLSARFGGMLMVPRAGEYTFLIDCNDGARIWIDNRLVFDEWESSAIHKPVGGFTLPAGPVPFCVEWYNRRDNGWLGILWEGPGVAREFIPATALRPDPGVRPPR